MFTKVIGISGKVSSGKSTLSKLLRDKLNIPIVSFGKFLVDYSMENHLCIDRESLQNLGNEMIFKDPRAFLSSVLTHANVTKGKIILEGIRHIVIWDEMKRLSEEGILIFVDTAFNLRYERFLKRIKEIDLGKYTKDHFNEINSHPVEAEISDLENISNIIINGDSDFEISSVVKEFILLHC